MIRAAPLLPAGERPRQAFRAGRWAEAPRTLAAEAAVAITVNGTTQAVMMASPADLEDFAIGFALTEGLVAPGEIEGVEVLAHGPGAEARLWVAEAAAARLAARRRRMAGPVGCGLCGIESIEAALRPPPVLPAGGPRMTPEDVLAAMAALPAAQALHGATRAAHAAGFWRPGQGLALLREDVGRHNALDKLAGALARRRADAGTGAVVMTSRVSIDLVQKCAAFGARLLVAAAAPTADAVALAEAAGLTLVANARGDGFDLFTHPGRVAGCASACPPVEALHHDR
ncbi:MAG: formate dehydrogenase accessory sulfurtransferase FdhD [Rhodobacteraceae bacterium]|jgi:FdhD protein|nr:formate dehydrogenase accessory sulfurtransferase FdhD [Paracoccaceae bacterium]